MGKPKSIDDQGTTTKESPIKITIDLDIKVACIPLFQIHFLQDEQIYIGKYMQ